MKKFLSDIINSFENTIVDQNENPLNKDEEKELLQNAIIESLVFDSRDVKENSLFFALPGTHTTGNRYIAQAVKNGCDSEITAVYYFASENIPHDGYAGLCSRIKRTNSFSGRGREKRKPCR